MDNKKNGQGTFVYTDLNVKYNGYWENGKRHGNGTIIFSNGDEV